MESELTPAGLTRRQVLKTAGTGLFLLLPMLPQRAWGADQWTGVGKSAQFPLNQPTRVALDGGGVVYITRLHAATFAGVSAKCTHQGCEVGWNKTDSQFVCPCHGAVFATDGKNVHGTRRRPDAALPALASVPVRQKNGQVEVNLAAIAPETLKPGREG